MVELMLFDGCFDDYFGIGGERCKGYEDFIMFEVV